MNLPDVYKRQNLNSVLFTSAAVGGKPDGGLTEVPEYSGNEWKLTLLDLSLIHISEVRSYSFSFLNVQKIIY